MTIARTVADVLDKHVTLELEDIDRMYLNVYVPPLQRELGVVAYFKYHKQMPFVSSVLMDPISKRCRAAVEAFVTRHGVPKVVFAKGERKDNVMAARLTECKAREGVVFVGQAQEKAKVFRTEKRRNPVTGQTLPWLVWSTAMVNHLYCYCVDRDFGPFFLQCCTYCPYNATLCLNGHEYVKRQLAKAGLRFVALDNGLLACEDPARMQPLADGVTAEQIDALLRKWLQRLPHPFDAADRAAGYRYRLSILQAECSLTQVLDRPVTGRVFFEDVIRENLDIGRPDQVQLILQCRVSKRTPGRFRTRVMTEGVVPTLHVDYTRSRIKQYHKEGRALRTEMTINDTHDFDIGRGLHNLSALRKIGFTANRRLLDVQRISHDCAIGEEAFERVHRPARVHGQRAAALRIHDARAHALFTVLLMFRLLPRGFSHADMRKHVAPLLGIDPSSMTQGRMSYDLRRLRLHGLIARMPHSHRYRVTDFGLRTAMFMLRALNRIIRPGLAVVVPEVARDDSALRRAFDQLQFAMDSWCDKAKLAA